MYKLHYSYCQTLVAILFLFATTEAVSQVNSVQRYEIDVKREEMNISSPNSLPNEVMLRAREFIKKDPTYYVGYMFEGFYRYDRSGDVAGYIQALKPLKYAMELFERDYSVALRDTYSSSEAYEEHKDRLYDYIYITEKLMDCYSNIERPDSVMWLLHRYKSWEFQHDELGADNYIAWTYHRNRFYTSEKYGFLYNSVEENEMVALHFLKQNLENINRNAARNESVISHWQIIGAKLSIYHYMSIIYSYLHKPDSALLYYNYMKPYTSIFPYNNYAIFCFTTGFFEESHSCFRYASFRDTYDRYRLKESLYYMSILDVMKAEPQISVADLSLYIRQSGVRPGWGWYNMGLARALMYNGQLDSSLTCINKAGKFNDVHIGTTWGQNHYQFSYTALKYINLQRQEAAIRFENKSYWMSPSKLQRLAEIKIEQYILQMLIFDQLSSNPERNEVYYRLFASEATISFDEIYYMLKDYGQNYFIKEFGRQSESDERESIRKYFKLFQGKLYLEKGDTRKALRMLDKLYNQDLADNHEYEKLYLARLYEALALANDASGTKSNFEKFRNQFYQTYPQLVPYSPIKMKFRIDPRTNEIISAKKILSDLNTFNVDFVTKGDNLPVLKLNFGTTDDQNIVEYSVESSWGTAIIKPSSIVYTDTKDVAKKLVYSIFNLRR
jgi:tetratricopeptide (TPR) repeat protein